MKNKEKVKVLKQGFSYMLYCMNDPKYGEKGQRLIRIYFGLLALYVGILVSLIIFNIVYLIVGGFN